MPALDASAGALRAAASGLASAPGDGDAAELDRMLRFVMESMDQVVQAKARTEGEGHARVTRFHARGEVVPLGSAAAATTRAA